MGIGPAGSCLTRQERVIRKSKIIQITDDGRDKGKSFLITEMPAMHAEKWAARALLAVSKSGVNLPDTLPEGAGMAELAVLGLKALASASFEELEPLLDEMMRCVGYIPDLNKDTFTIPASDENIEEVATIIQLRAEVFTLHTGFSFAAAA